MTEVLRPTSVLPRALSEAEATVLQPAFKLMYQGRDITREVTRDMLSISYTDVIEGESDSIDVTLEDTGLKWIDQWYPQFADRVTLEIGYAGQPLLPCGEFEVDEMCFDGPPDIVRIRALGAGVKKSYRTKAGRAYEDTTLAAIAQQIAARVHLQLVGTIEPIRIVRVTQLYERDLAFLKRIAAEYGYAFTVKGAQLVFFKSAELKSADAVLEIPRAAVTRWSLKDKVKAIYAASTVTYHNPTTKRTIKRRVQDGTALTDQNTAANSATRAASGDELNLNVRAEDDGQAQAKARAALERANEDQTQADLTLFGEPRLAAGVNVKLVSFGKFSGVYQVTRARHELSRGSGYTTGIECKRVR